MPLDRSAVTDRLRSFNFSELFTQELGWDNPPADLPIVVGGEAYTLRAVAQKRGMVAYELAFPADAPFPGQTTRRRIEREVAKSVREHFIIFTDSGRSTQIWQWVRREPGRPLACRETIWQVGASPEPIIQRLAAIAVGFDEEANVTLVDVTVRVGHGFDMENVTKRFYERFKAEHTAFLPFLTGIPDAGLQRWYASVMLNRLMFLYFIQKKGFLAADEDYLPHRLAQTQAAGQNFYHDFLCPLFFDGLAKPSGERTASANALLGEVPYLNGGIFQQHQVERLHGQNIQVADAAFERLFAFFRGYQWHLDDRPLRRNDEINPDVLGYIFEKYINQKQMGAYYTKEDITEYISKNCVIPFLLDGLSTNNGSAFEGEHSVWGLLAEQPNRYIHDAIQYGVDQPLPSEVASGVEDVGQRGSWNQPAPPEYALTSETWREFIARRQRCLELRRKLAAGEIQDSNSLVTANFNIRQFAQDVIENSDPNLLVAWYDRLHNLSVLDPTCGSGAFLFATLLVLEPLYAACLDRMRVFVGEWQQSATNLSNPSQANQRSRFESILADAAGRPSERYFILKNIVTRNLYGVDIMEEATEICKLRLFLKLVAQVEPNSSKPNLGIEPLPDIDFNVRAGNTLVGYATRNEVRRAMQDYGDGQMRLGVEDELQSFVRFTDRCSELDTLFQNFRSQQMIHGGNITPADKQLLVDRLGVLEEELNRYLAKDYDIRLDRTTALNKWRTTHRPFHWFVEFHEIMSRGGFDVIVGNPPYVETSKVKEYSARNYKTKNTGNLYALCVERSVQLLAASGALGLIVPLSGFSTGRMDAYQEVVWENLNKLIISYYSGDAHPAILFEGVKYRLCIMLGRRRSTPECDVYTSEYMRWYADERPTLFTAKVWHARNDQRDGFLRFAKVGLPNAQSILKKMLSVTPVLGSFLKKAGSGHIVYHRSPVFFIRSMNFEPYFKSSQKERSTDHLKDLRFNNQAIADRAGAVLNSTCFYFWFTVQGNCRNVAGPDIESLPIGNIQSESLVGLENAFSQLMDDLKRHSVRRVYNYEASGRVEYDEFYPDKSKQFIDEIDKILAVHYGFSPEETDFLINYDVKYRMGRE